VRIIEGAPGTYIGYDKYGRLNLGFSMDSYQAYINAQTSYAFKLVGVSNPSIEEQQKELAAIELGKEACAGQSPSDIAGCIQDSYNTIGDGVALHGGNYNFSYSDITIQGASFDPGALGGFASRCGSIDSVHFHDDGTLHVDTASPLGILGVAALIHLTFDIIGGNTWWSGGIPDPGGGEFWN